MTFVVQNFPAPQGFELKAMRERSENIFMKVNEKLIGTFKGTEEERQIKVDENTGKIQILNRFSAIKN